MSRRPDAGKRKRILEAAYHSFGILGFERATLKDIAERASLAPGTIYTYFTDKRDLFRHAVNETWEEFHDAVDRIIAEPGNYEQKMHALESVGLDLLRRVHPILHSMFSEAVRMDMFSSHLDRLCDQLEKLYLQGRDQGEIYGSETYQHRRFLLRTFASGVLLQLSIVPPENLDEEIEMVRTHLQADRALFVSGGTAGQARSGTA
ncbi:MAG: TetR/AcrR family transcriptional regulator [Spirochaetales bacterium]